LLTRPIGETVRRCVFAPLVLELDLAITIGALDLASGRESTIVSVSPLAGEPAPASLLVNVPRLVTAYFTDVPDPSVAEQRVAFGTSGHRGSSLQRSFNERHILAASQAICDYRSEEGIDGPLFLGMDTHALSEPAFATALEVLAANGVEVMIAEGSSYTPTPAVSQAILVYNRGRDGHLADGIVITPSHNPPDSGGFKYNPPNGGPADVAITQRIELRANELLGTGVGEVKRMPLERALRSSTTHRHNFLDAYVRDLGAVLDMEAIRAAGIRLGVDPLGGAGVHYWGAIGERYGLKLTVTNEEIDPTFRFMTVDWDGRIRMDPSSPHAMRRLLGLKERFDIAFACDTDHDRHGIVTRTAGLLPPNHYLAVAVWYLFRNRPQWKGQEAVGKTVVTSLMLDRVAASTGRRVYETPVGFKWFVEGLLEASLGFAGEESAGASLLRRNGTVWTTDKDGIALALLSAEITARSGHDPAELYHSLTRELGDPAYERIDAPASLEEKQILARLTAEQIGRTQLAGERIERVLTRAPGNGAAIGGVKVITANGWFAARPSGTENVYKIYAESLRGADHLKSILEEAQALVGEALRSARK
jgi:phosphoglucomutase